MKLQMVSASVTMAEGARTTRRRRTERPDDTNISGPPIWPAGVVAAAAESWGTVGACFLQLTLLSPAGWRLLVGAVLAAGSYGTFRPATP